MCCHPSCGEQEDVKLSRRWTPVSRCSMMFARLSRRSFCADLHRLPLSADIRPDGRAGRQAEFPPYAALSLGDGKYTGQVCLRVSRLGPDLGLWQAKTRAKPHATEESPSPNSVIQDPLRPRRPISPPATHCPQNRAAMASKPLRCPHPSLSSPPYNPTCTIQSNRQRLSEVCIHPPPAYTTICQLYSVYLPQLAHRNVAI